MLNAGSVIMTFVFNWMSLLHIFIISSLTILYNDDNIFGDLSMFLFIMFVFDVCCFYDVLNC